MLLENDQVFTFMRNYYLKRSSERECIRTFKSHIFFVSFQFLSELTRFFQRSKTTGSCVITMKKCKLRWQSLF